MRVCQKTEQADLSNDGWFTKYLIMSLRELSKGSSNGVSCVTSIYPNTTVLLEPVSSVFI